MKNITVSAKEAAAIGWHGTPVTFDEIIAYCKDLSCQLDQIGEPREWGEYWNYIFAMALWNAGRVQGIREERAKRRNNAADNRRVLNETGQLFRS